MVQLISLHSVQGASSRPVQGASSRPVQGASSRPVQGARRLWRPLVACLLLACGTATAEELTQVNSALAEQRSDLAEQRSDDAHNELVDPWPAAKVRVVPQEITTSTVPLAPQTAPSSQNPQNQLEVTLVDEFEDPWGTPPNSITPKPLPLPLSEPWLE